MGKVDQAVQGPIYGVVGGGIVCHVNTDCCAPLGKPVPVSVVDNTLVVEAIKAAAAPGLALVASHKGLEAGVNLDAGDHTCRLQ